MKLLTIVGARPQFIKVAAVSHALKQNAPQINHLIVHTGQHYDEKMVDFFFNDLDIDKPAYKLHVGSGTHGKQTGEMLEKIETVLFKEKPDYVLVYGDTNSTLAGALAAAKLHIPVAHIESGLRSFNRKMPEELNRICADHLATLLFAPSETTYQNLINEGINKDKIYFTGDVMCDMTLKYKIIAEEKSQILEKLNLKPKSYILCTTHRPENVDDNQRLTTIMGALIKTSEQTTIVLPLHPRTKQALLNLNLFHTISEHIKIIEPVGYLDMAKLQGNASVIVTDSGGMQNEAYCHQVPCVTIRDETEWPELIENRWNKLVPPISTDDILNAIKYSIGTKGESVELFGYGNASNKIVNIFLRICKNY